MVSTAQEGLRNEIRKHLHLKTSRQIITTVRSNWLAGSSRIALPCGEHAVCQRL